MKRPLLSIRKTSKEHKEIAIVQEELPVLSKNVSAMLPIDSKKKMLIENIDWSNSASTTLNANSEKRPKIKNNGWNSGDCATLNAAREKMTKIENSDWNSGDCTMLNATREKMRKNASGYSRTVCGLLSADEIALPRMVLPFTSPTTIRLLRILATLDTTFAHTARPSCSEAKRLHCAAARARCSWTESENHLNFCAPISICLNSARIFASTTVPLPLLACKCNWTILCVVEAPTATESMAR